MTLHPLDEAREIQQATEPDWRQVAEEGILEVLRHQDEVHGDDIATLGIPDAHSKVRGLAFSALRQKGLIVNTERLRASRQRSRKTAKSFVYRRGPNFPYPATAGVRTGVPSPRGTEGPVNPAGASADSGGAVVDASAQPEAGGESRLRSCASVDQGEGSPGNRHDDDVTPATSLGSSAIPGEPAPLSLFEMPASESKPPVSAVTGQRRAA